MCTLVLAWQVFTETPVAVAANRDEALDRPSEPPARREWDRPVMAPRDANAGGTWIGYNDAGVFVGITNRWLADSPPAERSRGLLVRDALECGSAEAAAREVERAVERDSYDGFNLVIADANAALYLEWDGRLSIVNFEPGVHVVVNVGADGRYSIPSHRPAVGEHQGNNADRVRTALQPEPGEDSDVWLDRAADVIADHDYGVCVHGLPDGIDVADPPADANFGTRSSSLISIGGHGRAGASVADGADGVEGADSVDGADGADGTTYRFADGPPCRTDYRAVEGQL